MRCLCRRLADDKARDVDPVAEVFGLAGQAIRPVGQLLGELVGLTALNPRFCAMAARLPAQFHAQHI